jgi:hypothetical protein
VTFFRLRHEHAERRSRRSVTPIDADLSQRQSSIT